MINNVHDYARMQNEWWYRIPIDTAPPIIQRKEAKIIAFYSTALVKEHKWQIWHYGIIKQITEVSRQELFPEESPYSRKADKCYYKIELEKLEELPQPIVSRRGHRNVFIPTTEQRFFGSTDINYLFSGSSLKEKFTLRLKDASIPFEREWRVTMNSMTYFLDFAIFCKTRPIDVECDGNHWHDYPAIVHYDKHRNNELASKGWSVLRFTEDDIKRDMDKSVSLLYDTIDRCGGYEVLNEPDTFSYVKRVTQLRLDF
ncbi:MAG: endonuclease domain-containing protein [Saprospiraceae bacterium]|nr:endonuclease domain-containing protein [Saprospiraceae bacterium]MCF8249577.1 endonuclease domain-containing protein [Saprospiraceae bacterium]MCF8280477.1 endonuclease domain-containing protein [Bacteroidales bacterium]MCF8310409.1 endonuclease domain-containing protein [Saprospiraceae bacterium]MCF8439787.1 endonuclease domain-containing protein [Saprospiraceae bacterium]